MHVAVDRDVHLLPPLGVHGQILSKVAHLLNQQVSGTREVLLQVLGFVTHVDHHVRTETVRVRTVTLERRWRAFKIKILTKNHHE